MDIINRIKNILVNPKMEWQTIEAENAPHMKVFTSYVVPLALIPAVAAFIGYGLIGYSVLGHHVSSVSWGLRQAIVQYAAMLGGTYITAFVIDALAANFGAKKDFDRAFSLVAYAYTPMFVGGVFYLLPSLSWLASLAGLYGLYRLATDDESPCRQAGFVFRCQPDSHNSRIGSPFICTCGYIVAGRIFRVLSENQM